MVYRRKPKLNRRLRGTNKRYKKGFKKAGNTNSYYHSSIPRTLQIATRRNHSEMLRFVVNQTYMIEPKVRTGGANNGPENVYLQYRANSIVDVMAGTAGNGSYNIAGTWISQDPANYGTTENNVNAEGVTAWQQRYQHFTVLGSRIQASIQTIKASQVTTDEQPGTFYINLSGYQGAVNKESQATEIVELPYTKRARIISAVGNNTYSASSSVPGARLLLNYSAKKFEGVKDVLDNSNMKGHFENSLGNQAVPVEQSYFNIGFVPTMPYTDGTSPLQDQLLTVKIEYIVKLTEPTASNQVSA